MWRHMLIRGGRGQDGRTCMLARGLEGYGTLRTAYLDMRPLGLDLPCSCSQLGEA